MIRGRPSGTLAAAQAAVALRKAESKIGRPHLIVSRFSTYRPGSRLARRSRSSGA